VSWLPLGSIAKFGLSPILYGRNSPRGLPIRLTFLPGQFVHVTKRDPFSLILTPQVLLFWHLASPIIRFTKRWGVRCLCQYPHYSEYLIPIGWNKSSCLGFDFDNIIKSSRIFLFAFVQWKVEWTQVWKTDVAGESPLQQEIEQGWFRQLRIALCLTPLTTF